MGWRFRGGGLFRFLRQVDGADGDAGIDATDRERVLARLEALQRHDHAGEVVEDQGAAGAVLLLPSRNNPASYNA